MEIRLPEKPKIEQKPDKGEDLRKFAVLPFGAIFDRSINPFSLRVLAALASYANRAGVCYVSQYKLAKDLKTTQSRISKAMSAVKAAGWIKEIGKPVQGIRGATVQILFAPDMDIKDAVAVASAKTNEDLRPPEQKEQELAEMIADNEKQWTEEELRENKERLAKMLLTAFKTPKDSERSYQPVKGDTQAVKKVKQEIRSRMRQLRKQQYEEMESPTPMPIGYTNIKDSLYVKKDITPMPEKILPMSERVSDQRQGMTYEAIVNYLKQNLFNGVKSEDDLQGCAWLSDLNVTVEQLERYLIAYPSDTAYQLCKRVIAGMS